MYKSIISTLIVTLIILLKMVYNTTIEYIKEILPVEKKLGSNMVNYNIHKKYVDNILIEKNKDFYDDYIIKDLAHFTVKGGKRVRSVLISSIYEKYMNKDINDIYDNKLNNFICSIEYTHAASLILDDIMDGDVTRRGETCLYVTHGVAKTQLIAMMLLSQAFKKIHEVCLFFQDEETTTNPEFNRFFANICKEIFDNYESCAIGQYLDLYGNEDIKNVLHRKTVTLFEISYLLVWILITKEYNLEKDIDNIKEISHCFGMFFQISDDFSDIESDKANGSKFNYILNYGIEKAYDDLHNYRKKWFEKSVKMNIDTLCLYEIFEYLWNRSTDIYNNLC